MSNTETHPQGASETETDTGWVWIQGQFVTIGGEHKLIYNWDHAFYPTREAAIYQGFADLDHDDFNVAHVEGSKVTWVGWMHEEHTGPEDRQIVAEQFGWSS